MPAKRETPIQDAADELDLSLQTVRRDIKDRHCPHTLRNGRYYVNVPEYKAWRDAQGFTGERGRPEKELSDQQAEKDKWLARKYRIQALKEEGSVIPVAEVEKWIGDHLAALRARLLSLGDELTPVLEGRDAAERAEIINGRVRELLTELAGAAGRLHAAKPDAAAEGLPG